VGLSSPPGSPHRLLRGEYVKIGLLFFSLFLFLFLSLVGLSSPPGSPHRLLRGKYVKIGGAPGEWVLAGLKRTIGVANVLLMCC